MREFADRSGFAYPVYAYYHKHGRGVEIEFVGVVQTVFKRVAKGFNRDFFILDLFFYHSIADAFDYLVRRRNGNIGRDESVEQIVVKVFAYFIAGEKHAKFISQPFFCLFKGVFYFAEKSHITHPIRLRLRRV